MDEQQDVVEAAPGEVQERLAWPPRQRPLKRGEVDARNWSVEVDEADEIDDEERVPVDPPVEPQTVYGTVLAAREAEVPAAIPAWLRNRLERRAVAGWAWRYATAVVRYRASRSWLYAAKLGWRAPRGMWRVLAFVVRWTFDLEASSVRGDAIRRADVGEYMTLSRQRNERVRTRGLIVLGLSVVVLIAAGVTWWLAPRWSLVLVVVLAVGLLGKVGTNADNPVLDPVRVVPRVRRLTADVVARALVAAKLAKDPAEVMNSFPQPIAREGEGWRAVIDLPYGVTAEQAIKRRDAIASGLDLDEVQVWPERVRGNAGSARRLALWVADEDPFAKGSGPWPLIEQGTTDVFRPFPFGTDQRGRAVPLGIMFTSLIVGSIPRMGKTFAMRLVALACALDILVELHIYDGKGGQDWRPFARIAHRCGFGVRLEVVETLRNDLQALVVEMNRRYDVLGELPPDLCPESKVTRQLAEKRSLGLHPILISIDEFQRYSEHKDFGDDIVELLVDLAKVGPAVGILIALGTQKPDADSIPTKLRDVIGTRFALKTMTWQSSEAVLGAGTYPAGHDASKFQRSHKGVGILLGADDSGAVEEVVTVRTNIAASRDTRVVVDRAFTLRHAAGRLTGDAIGEMAPAGPDVSLLEDLLIVIKGDSRVWSQDLVQLLADMRPELYGGWTPEMLAAALKPLGVETKQIPKKVEGGERINRRGVHREHVIAALEKRSIGAGS